MKLKIRHHFDSAHRLEFHQGLCKNIHGHRWDVNIEIDSDKLDENGLLIDFKHIKEIINELDHSIILKDCIGNHNLINVLQDMDMRIIILPYSPTAENLSKYIEDLILQRTGFLSNITLFESPEASIEFQR